MSMDLPTELKTLLEMLEGSLLARLDWRCIGLDVPDAHKPGFDDSGWSGHRAMLGRGWQVGWFRTRFVVPELLDGCALEVSPSMGGRSRVFLNGRLIGSCGSGGSVSTPRVKDGQAITLAVRNENGWISYENPYPAAVSCDHQKLLLAVFEQLYFLQRLREAGGPEVGEIDKSLQAFLAAVDRKALSDGQVGRFVESLSRAQGSLLPVAHLLKQFTIYVVPHSHVDLAWGWTYEETKRIMRTIFDRATELMDHDRDYTFAQDQPPAYSHLEGTGLMGKVARYIKEGRLEPCGAMYSEPEGNMPCGESFVRQVMISRRYFQDRFGADPKGCWNLDSFSGHCWSLPQILRKSGVRYYTFANWGNLIPDVEFWWEGPDGSRVLAYHLPCHYDSAQMMEHRKILGNLFGYASRSKFKRFMFLDGDDLTPPLRASIEGVRWFSELPVGPTVKFSTSSKFFEDLEEDGLSGIPTYRGELAQYLDPRGGNNVGSYSTYCEVKRRNRLCENLLLAAEKFGSIAMLAGMEFPRGPIRRAWEGVLLNQMHDILPGTAIKEAYDEAHRRYDDAEAVVRETIAASLGRISSRVDTRGKGTPVLVFNSLNWERTDVVEVKVTLDHSYRAWPRIIGPDGKEAECQVLADSRGTFDKTNRNLTILFVASKVPALGYKLYRLTLDGRTPRSQRTAPKPTEFTLENDYLKAAVDAQTGLVRSLVRGGHEFVSESEGLVLQRYLDAGDPWHIKLAGDASKIIRAQSVDLVERGPVRTMVRVTRKEGNTDIVQEVSLCKAVPRLVCRIMLSCRDMYVLYKASVPVNLGPAQATFEIPFATITRDATGIDRPAQNWVDLSDAERGLAVLNDGRYGYDIEGGTAIRLTLLRNPKGHRSNEGTDTGIHSTSLALYPHEGDWTSDVVRQGLEFNNPLLCHVDSQHEGDLPSSLSFLSLSVPGAVVSCLKPHEDSEDLVLRIYEAHGKGIEDVGMRGMIKCEGLEEIDMTEREAVGKLHGKAPVPLSPYEIKTLRMRAPRI